jgi:hypothetical protein
MTRYWTILWLKLLDLLTMRSLMLVFTLVPLGLGLIAGTANLANQRPDIRLAIVDFDRTAASSDLVVRLVQNGWDAKIYSESEAQRQLARSQVNGIVTIEEGYATHLDDLKSSSLRYTEAEGSLVTSMVREAVAAAVMPDNCRQYLIGLLIQQYRKSGVTPPSELEATFTAAVEAYASGEARLKVDYIGTIQPVPVLTFVMSDYSMEIIFLSIYAILGVITLSRSSLRRRLAAARHGLLADYTASIAALFIVGLCQVVIYSGAMRLLMRTPLKLVDIGLFAVFLLLMLGLGQLLSLINRSLRLYLSLLLLLLSAIAGGCFFQLSELLLRSIGQFTPHGWLLSMFKGYPALPFYIPLLLAFALLVFGFYLQRRRVVSET